MSLPPIGSIGSSIGRISPLGAGGAGGAEKAAGGSGQFSSAITQAIDNVGGLERQADNALASFASGGPVGITDVMAATSKASLGMSVVNEIRNRGLEAYQQILSVQV